MPPPLNVKPDGFHPPPIILTPPAFHGTLEEYLAVREADIERHAWIVASCEGMRPTLIERGAPSVSDEPEPVTYTATSGPGPTTSRPAPTGPADNIVSSQGGQMGESVRTTSVRPLPLPLDLPYLSAKSEDMRLVEPLMAERQHAYLAPGLKTTDIPALQLKAVEIEDEQSLMRISPTISRKLYTMKLRLDKQQHPQHAERVYSLPIDTASKLTWFYYKGFLQIAPQEPAQDPPSLTTIDWPTKSEDEKCAAWVKFKRAVLPVHKHTRTMLPFATHSVPGSDEWKVDYADGSAVYVRHVPDSIIKVDLPVWSWTKGKPDIAPQFELPCILAFAANEQMIKFKFDGNIGLSVPTEPKLTEPYTGPMADRNTFIDALEWPDVQVDEPRHFLIKLNHPDKLEACSRNKAEDFLYFGKQFPCPLKPRFTPPIPTFAFQDKVVPEKFNYLYWMFGMKSMSLMVPDGVGGFSELKIDMVDPRAEPRSNVASDVDPWADLVFVILDTGSGSSLLPSWVQDEIRDTWLKNSKDVLALPVNRRVSSYCGPERNLDGCDIVFTFVGFDHKVVDFRCPALPFLKSSTRLPSDRGSREPPSRFCTNLGKPNLEYEKRKMFILGINFYWSAFVEHCAEPTSDAPNPYVRLAPQRAARSPGVMGHAEDFVFFPYLPPRLFTPAKET